MNYSDKLKHPNWQRKRLRVFEHAGFKCERCGADDLPLHAHHKVYFKGHKPWDYEDRFLECVCEDCHTLAHEEREHLNLIVGALPTAMVPTVTDAVLAAGRGEAALPPIHPRMQALSDRLALAFNTGTARAWTDAQNMLQDIADEQIDFQRGPGGVGHGAH